MENDFDTEKSMWQKSQSELTTAEAVTLTIAVTAVAAAIPLVLVAGIAGVEKLQQKRMVRKAEKELRKNDKKKEAITTTCTVKA